MRDVLVALVAVLTAGPAAGQSAPAPADAYAKLVQTGYNAIEAHQLQNAVKTFKRAQGLQRDVPGEADIGLALAYRGLGDERNAESACERALKHVGSNAPLAARLHNMRGSSLVAAANDSNTKALRDAEQEFTSAIAADPRLAIAHLNLGVTLIREDREEPGVAELRTFIAASPASQAAADARSIIAQPARARFLRAPDFTAAARSGQVHLGAFMGKVVLLDFWGSWCGPCRESAPDLITLHKALAAEPVEFIGIAMDEESPWRKFLDQHPAMEWPQVLDDGHGLVNTFGIVAYPTYIIIDSAGFIRARHRGWRPNGEKDLENEIRKLLAERN